MASAGAPDLFVVISIPCRDEVKVSLTVATRGRAISPHPSGIVGRDEMSRYGSEQVSRCWFSARASRLSSSFLTIRTADLAIGGASASGRGGFGPACSDRLAQRLPPGGLVEWDSIACAAASIPGRYAEMRGPVVEIELAPPASTAISIARARPRPRLGDRDVQRTVCIDGECRADATNDRLLRQHSKGARSRAIEMRIRPRATRRFVPRLSSSGTVSRTRDAPLRSARERRHRPWLLESPYQWAGEVVRDQDGAGERSHACRQGRRRGHPSRPQSGPTYVSRATSFSGLMPFQTFLA